jgi:hypothetical protein
LNGKNTAPNLLVDNRSLLDQTQNGAKPYGVLQRDASLLLSLSPHHKGIEPELKPVPD